MQRLYSTFPGRWPGIGLVLLRATAGVWAAIEGAAFVLGRGPSGESMLALAGGAIVLLGGGALVAGFLTPLAALVVALMAAGSALSWIPYPDVHLAGFHAHAWLVTIVAIGVALLGPGAFSVDSRMFGRREIIIPPPQPAVHE